MTNDTPIGEGFAQALEKKHSGAGPAETKPEAPDGSETEPKEEGGRSWEPLDLRALYNEHGLELPEATSLPRRDGHGLGYRGMANVLFGQPGSGKTIILLGCELAPLIIDAARQRKGKVVAFIDYEDVWQTFVSRLHLMLGVPLEDIFDHAEYIKPPGYLNRDELRADLDGHLTDEMEVVVIDSVNESAGSYGLDPLSQKDMTAWRQTVLNTVQEAAPNAALWLIDHETKAASGQVIQALGAQAKFAMLRGAQIRAVIQKLPKPGSNGAVALYKTKDNLGDVTRNSAPGQSSYQHCGTAMFNANRARSEFGLDMTIIEPQGNEHYKSELAVAVQKLIEGADEKGISRHQIGGIVRSEKFKIGDDDLQELIDTIVSSDLTNLEGIQKGNGVGYRPIPKEEGDNE